MKLSEIPGALRNELRTHTLKQRSLDSNLPSGDITLLREQTPLMGAAAVWTHRRRPTGCRWSSPSWSYLWDLETPTARLQGQARREQSHRALEAIPPHQLKEMCASCSAPSLPTEFLLVVVRRCMWGIYPFPTESRQHNIFSTLLYKQKRALRYFSSVASWRRHPAAPRQWAAPSWVPAHTAWPHSPPWGQGHPWAVFPAPQPTLSFVHTPSPYFKN